MISLGLAKELQAAGLKPRHDECELYWIAEVGEVMHVSGGYAPDWEDVWLPSLSQLLAEIEWRGYSGNLNFRTKSTYLNLYKKDDSCQCDNFIDTFYANTPEDAAGKALLWILQNHGARRPEITD